MVYCNVLWYIVVYPVLNPQHQILSIDNDILHDGVSNIRGVRVFHIWGEGIYSSMLALQAFIRPFGE